MSGTRDAREAAERRMLKGGDWRGVISLVPTLLESRGRGEVLGSRFSGARSYPGRCPGLSYLAPLALLRTGAGGRRRMKQERWCEGNSRTTTENEEPSIQHPASSIQHPERLADENRGVDCRVMGGNCVVSSSFCALRKRLGGVASTFFLCVCLFVLLFWRRLCRRSSSVLRLRRCRLRLLC